MFGQRNFVPAMSIMSSDRYSVELIKKYVRREMLMKSPLYDKWAEEEREEAMINRDKKRIIDTLELKFDFVSKDTRKYIKSINDENVIDRLFQKAVQTESLDEFEEFLFNTLI